MKSDITGSFNVVESTDLDCWRARPGNWDTRVTQLSRERFESRVSSIAFPDLVTYRNRFRGACLMQGLAPEGWVTLGASVTPAQAFVRWCGTRTDRHTFGIGSGSTGEAVDYCAEDGAETSVVLISPSLLQDTIGEEAADQIRRTRCLNLGRAGNQLVDLTGRLVAACRANPGLLSRPGAADRARSALLRAIEECGAYLQREQESLTRNSREEAVNRAVAHMRRTHEPASAWQLAQAAGVSQKSLESAFKQVLGMTPGKYLTMVRLNEVHHVLARSKRGDTTVADVAGDWGFTHLGRFSRGYRELFGELPSQTLNR